MQRNLHPAEDLCEIRAESRALKAREAETRAYFHASARPTDRRGTLEAAVSPRRRRVFARDRLPAEILNDPRNWAQKVSPDIRLQRRAPAPKRTGFAAPGVAFQPAMAADDDLLDPVG